MRAERLVLDTNVFVSALLLRTSTAGRVLDDALQHSRIIATNSTHRELIAAMLSPKFDKHVPQARREAHMINLAPNLERVVVLQIVRLCRDPHDDAVLEAALNGGAEAIVTGDKDLLALHPFRGIQILTPAAYRSRIAEGE